MDLASFITAASESIGDRPTGALIGLLTGIIFGLAGQRSAFCLRSAAIEFGRGRLGPAMAVWLLTFSTAMVWVQGAQMLGLFEAGTARQMTVTGSLSGAIIGGLVFGIGMVMARGCSGRLLVLAGTGNLRAIVAGLVFAITAQISINGLLAPLRERLATLWVTPGGQNADVLALLRLPQWAGLALGVATAVAALALSHRAQVGVRRLVWACGAGFAIALGWIFTFELAQVSFEPVSVTSATFAGPSANVLMLVLARAAEVDFDIGLIPGVFIGAFLGAAFGRELRIESFSTTGQLTRSLVGGGLMGFGGMLAGGCAIGAGLTGTSIFVLTAWIATTFFFVGAFIGDRIFDYRAAAAQAPVAVAH